ncbi:hypothetical protein BH09ACT5_BH09ACT5_01280 [soil metagenome]
MTKFPALFRIGPAFVDYWIHEVSGHWITDAHEDAALLELEEGLRRLLKKREAVEKARRAFAKASSLDLRTRPSDAVQVDLYEATQDFYLTFYSTLSSFASFLKRFGKELGGDVPHRSNSKFIDWLEPRALHSDISIPLLQEARQFRSLLDHKADRLPDWWGTANVEGFVRIFLHGPPLASGALPDGAMPRLPDQELPEGHEWTFVAPDEDRVLSALAIQLNAFIPVIGAHRQDDHRSRTCLWKPTLYENDPGFPILAIADGTVVYNGPASKAPPPPPKPFKKKNLSPREIDETLSKYFKKDERC